MFPVDKNSLSGIKFPNPSSDKPLQQIQDAFLHKFSNRIIRIQRNLMAYFKIILEIKLYSDLFMNL